MYTNKPASRPISVEDVRNSVSHVIHIKIARLSNIFISDSGLQHLQYVGDRYTVIREANKI